MSKATESAPSAAPVWTKARRQKRVNFPYLTPLRYGEAELDAVEVTRAAMAALRGRPVTFSEAARLLLRDKAGAAKVEAQAMAMSSNLGPLGAAELSPELLQFFNAFQRFLGHCQGSLNSVAKNLAYANKGLSFELTEEQVSEALKDVHALREWVDRREHLFILGED